MWAGARLGAGAALALFCLATCAARKPVAPELPFPSRLTWLEQVDWPRAQAEAVGVLQQYVRVNTSNPPGNEVEGALFLADWLAREGIEAEIQPLEGADERANLVARLKGSGAEPPLCLMHHIDVATADAAAWTHPPFSGHLDAEGYLWGRGTLDMKGIGILQMLSMAQLKRLGVPLRRDVVLLAVADEEVDNGGARALAERWDEIGCSQVINEGGMGIRDALVDGVTTFGVSYVEKGALWLRLHASGEPGHGSTPLDDTAPLRLLAALDAIRAREGRARISPELHTLLGEVGARAGGLTGAVLQSPGLTRALAVGQLMDNPLSRAIITDTVNITGFGGAEEPNVVPSEVWAQLDTRLLPGTTPEAMLAELRGVIGDADHYRFEVIHALEAVASPLDDPLYESIVRQVRVMWPDAAVGPLVMPGSTDASVLRPLGVHVYGIAPFALDPEELLGMHGDDERIHVEDLGRGLELMLRVVLEVAASDDGAR